MPKIAPSSTRPPHFLSNLIPPNTVGLLALALVLLPLALTGMKQLLFPLVGQLTPLFQGEALSLPLYFYIKAITFGILLLLTVSQVSLRLGVMSCCMGKALP
jgi:hypothetical protein